MISCLRTSSHAWLASLALALVACAGPSLAANASDSVQQHGYSALVFRQTRGPLLGRIMASDLDGLVIELQSGSRQSVPRSEVASVVRLQEGEDPLAVIDAYNARTQPAAVAAPGAGPLAGDRLFGFGFFQALGFGFEITYMARSLELPDDGPYLVYPAMDLPGFEFQIYPSREFSVDLVWHIGTGIFYAAETSRLAGVPYSSLLMTVYFHFHGPPVPVADGNHTSFGIAPGLRIGRQEATAGGYSAAADTIGLATRIGGEVVAPTRDFGFGVYFRPAVMLTTVMGYPEPFRGAELMVELTWTFYATIPAGS